MDGGPKVFPDLKNPFVLVIFGATGDLAHTRLIPGLLSLYNKKMLPDEFYILGFSRREYSEGEFKKSFEELEEKEEWDSFSKHIMYLRGTFEEEKGYQDLIEKLNSIDEKMGTCLTRFFYLATPPKNYSEILDNMVSTKLSDSCGHEGHSPTKVIIEKPFGKDFQHSKALEEKLSGSFAEEQIFRVDHYLGKETVQNILAFRFANSIFEPVWNNKFIDHVQITWAEKEGIGNRGSFFDGVGILRDVVQNHIMQLISAVVMEQPKSFTKEDVREERAKVTGAVKLSDSRAVRGQYEGYLNDANVMPASQTETYTAMKLLVETERFSGVPFYIRAGKNMQRDDISISVVFIQTCHILFKEYGCPEVGNVLTFRIQPNEGISLRVIAKRPGPTLSLGTVGMRFDYKNDFGTVGLDAYEKVLLDIFSGDQTLFTRSDEIQNSWSLLDSVLKEWQNDKNLPVYKGESWGPKEGIELIEKDNRRWL